MTSVTSVSKLGRRSTVSTVQYVRRWVLILCELSTRTYGTFMVSLYVRVHTVLYVADKHTVIVFLGAPTYVRITYVRTYILRIVQYRYCTRHVQYSVLYVQYVVPYSTARPRTIMSSIIGVANFMFLLTYSASLRFFHYGLFVGHPLGFG